MQTVKENKTSLKKSRAWLEINLDNLEHNIQEIEKRIPDNCNIMAVVKADAYGHGIIEVAKKLERIGIKNFAVATLQEGITLRKHNIKGNILILGYTHFTSLHYVLKYNLIQTIVDYTYAKTISKISLPGKIKAHIKINTGMNRIGESYKNINNIKKIYHIHNIKVLGIFTHLCVADSNKKSDIIFTKQQINNFHYVTNKLNLSGYHLGKIHIQSSYGLLNYPELKCNYVRVGIIMYGVHSEKNINPKVKLDLKPVLSLKARITSIKEIKKNDFVSYGRKFIATKPTKIATISIGYADGYPRCLSGKRAKVLVNNQYAEVIGRICMDQLMINISNIKPVKVGDVVTLIGNKPFISAETVAYKSETITNELLSRLGARLEKVYISKNEL